MKELLRLRVTRTRRPFGDKAREIAVLIVEESDGMVTIRREIDSPIKSDVSIDLRRDNETLTIIVEQP